MSVLSWIKLSVCLWLLRKAAKLTGWLLLAAAAVAAWPVTIVAAGGYVAAWLRGWPPARLRRGRCSGSFGIFRPGSGTAARSACSCAVWPPPC